MFIVKTKKLLENIENLTKTKKHFKLSFQITSLHLIVIRIRYP